MFMRVSTPTVYPESILLCGRSTVFQFSGRAPIAGRRRASIVPPKEHHETRVTASLVPFHESLLAPASGNRVVRDPQTSLGNEWRNVRFSDESRLDRWD